MKTDKLSSKQAAKELEKVRERLAEVKARIGEIRPPRPAPPAPRGGTGLDWDPLTGAGAEFRDAHEAEDVARLHELRTEFERLGVEEDHLLRRQEQLRQRERQARDEEARERAPAEAERLAKDFPEYVERLGAALEEWRIAKSSCERVLRELTAARRLAGDDAPGLLPLQLAHYWRVGLGPGERLNVELDDANAPGGNTLDARYVQDVRNLVRLPKGAVELVVEFLGGTPAAERDAPQLVRHELVRLIAAGGRHVDDRELAHAAIERVQPRSTSPERRAERADSWLRSRSRDKLLHQA